MRFLFVRQILLPKSCLRVQEVIIEIAIDIKKSESLSEFTCRLVL